MKRVDKLTKMYTEAYLDAAEENLHAYKGGFCIIRPNTLDLRKMSFDFPESYIKKDGTVSKKRISALIKKRIRAEVVSMLGWSCGINRYGKFERYFKREGLTYSRYSTQQHLKSL